MSIRFQPSDPIPPVYGTRRRPRWDPTGPDAGRRTRKGPPASPVVQRSRDRLRWRDRGRLLPCRPRRMVVKTPYADTLFRPSISAPPNLLSGAIFGPFPASIPTQMRQPERVGAAMGSQGFREGFAVGFVTCRGRTIANLQTPCKSLIANMRRIGCHSTVTDNGRRYRARIC